MNDVKIVMISVASDHLQERVTIQLSEEPRAGGKPEPQVIIQTLRGDALKLTANQWAFVSQVATSGLLDPRKLGMR